MDAAARRKVLYLVGVLLVTFDLLTCVHSQGDVRFSLRNITYQNNSIVMIEDIGEHDDALLCMTDLTKTNSSNAFGNWFFPDGTVIPSDNQSDIYRSRGEMVVRMHRRRGGEEGIYRCEIPDSMNVTQSIYIGVYSASTGAGDVWFSLRDTTYQNNSKVILENIGEGDDDALLCITNQTACCHGDMNGMRHDMGNWFFPNGTKIHSENSSGEEWDFYRSRGQMVVRLHHRGGGEEGIYSCEIPDTLGFIQTIYIGVYSGAGDVQFSLKGTTYQNNSNVILENIGEGGDALFCVTHQTACCRPPYTTKALGNWFFPNGTRVPSSGVRWDFHRTRGPMMVRLQRRRGGAEGIYHCVIPDILGVVQTIYIGVYSLSAGAHDVWFVLNGTTYKNNSIVILEDIDEGGDDALLCITNQTACCRPPYTSGMKSTAIGNWYFPNGTRVPSSGNNWDFHRTRARMTVRLHRRRGGAEGIYRCVIPDTFGFIQNLYIGVYSASTGSPNVTSLTYDEQSRTLTCTSTGGPAATVTWRRNGVVITLGATYQQTKNLVDSVNGTYQTVLAIDPSLHYSHVVGTYNCSVENARGESSETVVVTGADDIWFSLRGIPYRNNSIVTLEDIGKHDDALLCVTNQTACCRHPYTGENVSVFGNWFLPNGSRVPSKHNNESDFFRDRGHMVVRLNHRSGGEEGIYRCQIPDTMNVTQTIYIGVYSGSTGSPNVTSLTYDDQSRTLTCTSTGGPATIVSWRRNGVVIILGATYQQTKTLVDSVTGTYQTVLTIDPSLHYSRVVGNYNCTVENARGDSSETVVVPGDVWFSLRNTTYQNNSNVILEDIGEGDDALLCKTDLTTCCHQENASAFGNWSVLGNWFFPNGTRVPSSEDQWDFHRTRGQMVVRLNRRRGGVEAIYRCEIPVTINITQTAYIGVYSTSTVTPPHPSMQPTPEATTPPHEPTQSTPGTVPVSSSTRQPTNTFPSDESTPSPSEPVPSSPLNGPIIIIVVTCVIIFVIILVGVCIVVVLCRAKKRKQQLEINKLQNVTRETEETELKLKDEVNTQNGTFKKGPEIEDEFQSDIEPYYEQLDNSRNNLRNGKPEVRKIKNKNHSREEPDAATQPYYREMKAQGSQKSFDHENENEGSLHELYATIQKEAPPRVPIKSAELVKDLESQNQNGTLDNDTKLIPADSEYALPASPSRLANISSPMFREMESNPMYQSVDQCRDAPSYTNVPEGAAASDDIYSTPDSINPQTGANENVSEAVYSEPIQPSIFTEPATGPPSDSEDLQPYGPIYSTPSVLPKSEEMLLKVSGSNIREIRELGTGLFGKVILAETVGLSPKDLRMSKTDDDKSKSTLVAVKTLKSRAPSTTKEAFEKEVNFMSRLNDRNVIRMLGVCHEDTPFIMMEYMEKGDLNNYLRKFKVLGTTDSESKHQITTSTLVHITTQIASAMKYLASHNYVHRDLATRNCLVGPNYLVKISDFGMSRSLYESHYYCIQGHAILPVRWMSVECFYGKFSQMSDVWAFGVTTWEIFTLAKEQPYNDMSDKQVVDDAIKGQKRRLLAKPEMCPPEVYNIMLKCWAHNTKKRATFEELFQLLDSIRSA